MASAMEIDSSDDEELLQPSFTTNTFTVTAEMVDNVLFVCPGVRREDIIKDLQYTNNVATTINRILDCRVTLKTNQASSLTIDTDIESGLDNDNHNKGDVMILETLSSPSRPNYKPKSPEKLENNLYTSKIIDLSFDDENEPVSTPQSVIGQAHPIKNSSSKPNRQNSQNLNVPAQKQSNDCRQQNSTQLENDIVIELDDQDSNTCEVRLSDVSSSDSDSESLPSVIPSLRQRMMSDMDVDLPNLHTDPAQEESVAIPKKKRKCNSEEAQKRKEQAQQVKAAKEAEKQAKKEAMLSIKREKEMEKLSKKAESMNQKSLRKEECLQTMQVWLDPGLLTKEQRKPGDTRSPILEKLASLGASYNVESQPVADSVTWKRTNAVHFVGQDLQLQTEKNTSDESHVIVKISSDWFVSMVDAYIKTRSGYSVGDVGGNSFQEFSRKLKQAYPSKTITVVVFELDKYFRSIKSKTARQYRSAVRGEFDDTSKSRKKNSHRSAVIVSQIDVQEFLVFVELTSDLKVTLCESLQEFADTVAMFTKAVAEAPFKRSQPEAFSFCVDITKSSVKVSKDGQGLVKLWQQQLQQFNNVSSNVAAAIVGAYPSPRQLMQGYKSCSNEHSAALLLKDILVRRGVGVLETSRRIGPELSRQIYILFNSSDGKTMTK